MTQAHHDEEDPRIHMGLPLSHGKLAMWLFLVTEIMFFTALIGTYMLIRNGTPPNTRTEEKTDDAGNVTSEKVRDEWPKPKDVHLVEWIGAANTFVLIVSSFTIVLAHHYVRSDPKKATRYLGITLALGCVFLLVKAYEYSSKFKHDILPGHIGEQLPGMDLQTERKYHGSSIHYVNRIKEQLAHITADYTAKRDKLIAEKKSKAEQDALLAEQSKAVQACVKLQQDMIEVSDIKVPSYTRPLSPGEVGKRVNELIDTYPELHLSPTIPQGNMWASFYFAMTGFHALHVLGGLVVIGILVLMGLKGKLGKQHESHLELTGLYWHFVDIVWIFLFPLLYLV